MTEWKQAPPDYRRGLPLILSDIRPDARYGLSPIVQFQLWAEDRGFKPGLGSATWRSLAYFRAVHLPSGTLLLQVSPAAIKRLGLARRPGARTSGLHRIDRDLDDAFASWHRALGAWEVTAAIAIFSLGTRSLRLKACSVNTKPPSKSFVKLERLEASARKTSRVQFAFPPNALRLGRDLHPPAACSIAETKRGTS